MTHAAHEETWRQSSPGRVHIEVAVWENEGRKIDGQGEGVYRDKHGQMKTCDVINDLIISFPTVGSRIRQRKTRDGIELLRSDLVWIPETDMENETLAEKNDQIGWMRESFLHDENEFIDRAVSRYLNRVDRKRYRGDLRGTTVSVTVPDGSGDADEKHTGGGLDSTGSRYDCQGRASDNLDIMCGLHFETVNVPASSTINSATVDVRVSSTSQDDAYLDIYCEDQDNPSDFGSVPDLAGRVKTTASSAWVADGVGAGFVTSPDFASAVQEVVDRAGWASGQNMTVIFYPRLDQNKSLFMRSYDWSSTYAATLDIDYTAGGGGGAAPTRTLLGVGK